MLKNYLKRLLSLMTVIAILLAINGYSEPLRPGNWEHDEVQWYTDFDEALSAASAQGKPVLLEFYSPL